MSLNIGIFAFVGTILSSNPEYTTLSPLCKTTTVDLLHHLILFKDDIFKNLCDNEFPHLQSNLDMNNSMMVLSEFT